MPTTTEGIYTTHRSCLCCQRVTKLLDPMEICSACWRHALLPRHGDGTIRCPVREGSRP